MANPTIGYIQCPTCGNPNATVHEQAKGRKKKNKYTRCYSADGQAICGTSQVTGPAAQKWIEDNMRSDRIDEPAAEPVPDPQPDPEAEPKPEKARGFMAWWTEADDEEDAA